MYEDVEEDLGPHSLLKPEGPKFTSALTQRALIVWNQLGRKNKFIDVYRFYNAIEKSESELSSRSREASQKLDFDLINTEPPTTTYLNDIFPNLYPDKRDFMVPTELKDSQYTNSQAPNLQQDLGLQANKPSNVSTTSVNLANSAINANEDVIFVSQMMRDYCIAHKTTLKEFILEFKAYADRYGVNATVSNVAFYMQYRTAVEQRGLPFNGIVNQSIPVQVPKTITQSSAQNIDVMEIFDNAVKNINNYGNSDYYQNLMTAYNYNEIEVQQAFNCSNASAHTSRAEVLNDNSIPNNNVNQNGNADYSAILKRNIVKTEQSNDKSTTNGIASSRVVDLPFDAQNNIQKKADEISKNRKLNINNTVADIISKNKNQMSETQLTNNATHSSYDDMNDIWNQLSCVTIDPNNPSFGLNNSTNSIKSCEVRTLEKTPEKFQTVDHREELVAKPGKKGKILENQSEKASKFFEHKVNSNGKTDSPKKVTKEGTDMKDMDDSNHSSFYLDAESSFSCPDSSIEDFERFKLRGSTSYQER